MDFEVLFTDDAAQDLMELYLYISEKDAVIKAERVLDKLEETCLNLAKLPERGGYPKELAALGIREYREIIVKPYRILYRIIENRVYIYLITDGRRDMLTLLEHRLFSKSLTYLQKEKLPF